MSVSLARAGDSYAFATATATAGGATATASAGAGASAAATAGSSGLSSFDLAQQALSRSIGQTINQSMCLPPPVESRPQEPAPAPAPPPPAPKKKKKKKGFFKKIGSA